MGLDHALGVALAGMERHDQVMDWARQCDWAIAGSQAMAFVLAAHAPEQFVPEAMEYCAKTVSNQEGRAAGLLVAALAGATSQGRNAAADAITDQLAGALRPTTTPSGDFMAHLSVEINKRVAAGSRDGWMPSLVDRLARACTGGAAAGVEASIPRRIAECCVEAGVGKPPSSRKLLSITKVLLKNGICFDDRALLALRRTSLASWPGTWIAIAHLLDARPSQEGHSASKACDYAIANILEDASGLRTNAAGRRQDNLHKLALGISHPRSLDLVAMASNPAEWTGALVATLMEKCAGLDETLLLEVVAMTMLGGSKDAWEACQRGGGAAALEKNAGQCRGMGKQATSMWDLAPTEARAGARAVQALGPDAASKMTHLVSQSRRITQATGGWDMEALHASISSALLDVQTVPTHLPGAPRRRM